MADVILRHIKRPDTYVRRTAKKVTLSTDEQELLDTKEWVEAHGDEPFIDPEELADPRVRMWREILRERYNFNKTRNERRNQTL